jgi:hypothetical protein
VQSIDKARAAYSRLMDAARKAQYMMKTIIPSNPVEQGLSELQERAMRRGGSTISDNAISGISA